MAEKPSSAQMILKWAQTMVDLEEKINQVEGKVQEMERVRNSAKEDIDSFPEPSFTPEPQNTRSMLNQYIRTYSRTHCLHFAFVWHKLYEAILYRKGISVHRRADHKKVSYVQILQDLGMMEYAYNLAREIFPL